MHLLGRTDVPFWGNRPYLHSSHLVETFLGLWAASGRAPLDRLVLAFRSSVTNNGAFMVVDDPREVDAPLLLHAHGPEGVVHVALLPDAAPVTRRLPDDEGGLTAGARIRPEERVGDLDVPIPERLFGTMVALVKVLHHACLPSEGYGRWYLVGADLDLTVMRKWAGRPMVVRMDREVGARMTRSTLLLGQDKAAQINFLREVQS